MTYRRGTWWLRLQNQRTTIPVNLLKTTDSCSGRAPSNLPQISKMHPMMFFLFLIMSPVWLLVQFSHTIMSNSLCPHQPQQAKPPCPSPTPGVNPKPCPLSQWCHPTISSSVIPFSSCPQSFPASRSFQMSQLFASGGQSIGVSALVLVLPMNTQD